MEIDELRSELSKSRTNHSRAVALASKFVKGMLVVGGAAIAGIAQFATWNRVTGPEGWQVVGIAATAMVAIGGFYVLITENDAADALEAAERAIGKAQNIGSRLGDVDAFFEAFTRLTTTYQVVATMQGAVEQAGTGSVGDISDFIKTTFDNQARALTIGIGFGSIDRYTLLIYRAQPGADPHKSDLVCIAQKRAIECRLEDARVWPEGVGIAGIAYSHNREIVLPDLQAEGMSAIFGPKRLTRDYDAERYVSMVSVPINVAGRDRPWGVVVATSDQEGFFSAEGLPGFKAHEPVRAIAAFVAVAVAMDDARNRARGASAPTVTPGSPGHP